MGVKTMNLSGGKPVPSKNVIRLYHGSPLKEFTPTYGKGKDNHDYGRGFYLTPDKELAKEWAVGDIDTVAGWVHSFELDLTGLAVLDFEAITKQRALYWVTEILQHREPSKRTRGLYYDEYKEFLLSRFKVCSSDCDVVTGWRADDSYFKIVSDLMDNRLQVSLLEDALRLGNLGIQYCCRTAQAFMQLRRVAPAEQVPEEYRKNYIRRDRAGRHAIFELVDSYNNKHGKPSTFMRDITLIG